MRLPSYLQSGWPFLLLGASLVTVNANHQELTVDKEFRSTFEDKVAVSVPSPTDLEFTPDGQYLFVTSKDGRIWRVNVEDMDDGKAEPELVFEIPHDMCLNGARGLGGIAVHPNYPSTPWIYVFHNHDKYDDCSTSTDLDEGPVNRFSRWTLNDDLDGVDKDSELVMFETRRLNTQTHNSGDIAFGKDGYVYVTVGEAGHKKVKNDDGIFYPMALDVMLGVVVRLTDEGEIPDTNPYTPAMGDKKAVRCNKTGESGDADKHCQEIYATGLRNPFRFAMDPNTPDDKTRFFVNEVGSNTWERVLEGGTDFAGANYGYPLREGPCEKSTDKNCAPNDEGYDEPVHWYHHNEDDGGAITGGAFVPNDAGWPSSMDGGYIYAEFAIGGIYIVTESEDGCAYPKCDPPISAYSPTTKIFSENNKVVGLQFGPHQDKKALYYLTHYPGGGGGKEAVYRIAYTDDSNRDPKADIEADNTVGFSPLVVEFDGSKSVDPDDGDTENLQYEWDFDGDGTVDSTKMKPDFEYTNAGIFEATLTVKDGKGGKDKTSIRIDVDNTPPQPVITSPAPGTTFAIGDRLILQGYATDAEDGPLPDTALTWEVRQHHNNHYHPFLDATIGNNIPLDQAPEPEDFDEVTVTTSYLAIHLTATDSNGLTSTTVYELKPRLVTVQFDSVPSGMTLLLDTDKFVTPVNLLTWENHKFGIEAAPSQELDGTEYVLKEWSDTGNRRTHDYVVQPLTADGEGPEPIVATYQKDKPMPPVPKIKGFSEGASTFTVGQELILVGSAVDTKGNKLGDSSLVWQVGIHYSDGDYEALLDSTSGNNVKVPAIPEPRNFDEAEVGYLEILLTATSEEGLTDTTSVLVHPELVRVSFDTNPPGLDLMIDEVKHTTPVTITTWENDKFNVKTSSQTMDGVKYSFAEWSDGGKRSHRYKASSSSDGAVVVADFVGLALPVPKIHSVAEGSKFAVGDKMVLKGSATDDDGNALHAKSLSWQVRLYNGEEDEYRTILKPTKGNNIEIDAPKPATFDEAAATSFIEILLTATDSNGQSSTESVIIEPKKVDLLLDSDPSGYYVFADGFQFRTPAKVTAWENQRIIISAPTQKKRDAVFSWYWWSDGGEASHEYVVPKARKNSKPRTIVAYLREAGTATTAQAAQQNSGAFIGVCVAAGIALLLVLCIILLLVRKKQKKGITIFDINNLDDDDGLKHIDSRILGDKDCSMKDGSNDGSDDLKGVSECSVFALSQQADASIASGSVDAAAAPYRGSLASVKEAAAPIYPTPIALSKYLLSSAPSNSIKEEGEESLSITRETMDATAPSICYSDESHDTEAGMFKDFALPDDKELDHSIDGMSLASSSRSYAL